jgi:hypothetical protein
MSDRQMLKWYDNRYWFSEMEGEYGKAMQWELRPELVYNPSSSPSSEGNQEGMCVLDENILSDVPPDYVGLRPRLDVRGRICDYDLSEGERLVEEMFS